MQAIQALPTLPEAVDLNIDWVIGNIDQAADLAEDTANRLIEIIMTVLAQLPFGDQLKQLLGGLCTRVCALMDSAEAYLDYLSENFDTIGTHEIAEKLAYVITAAAQATLGLAEQEMYLVASAEHAGAEFLERMGGHAPGKFADALNLASNALGQVADQIDVAGDHFAAAIEEIDERRIPIMGHIEDKLEHVMNKFNVRHLREVARDIVAHTSIV